jgi:hypothetical protein
MTTQIDTTIADLQDEIRHSPTCAQVTLMARAGVEAAQARRPALEHLQRVLEALAGSLAASYRHFAAALDIPLNNVEIRIEAGLDLNGLAAVNNVRAGPGNIRAEARLTSPADIYALERLRITVERHDPVLDLLRNVTPTRLEISINLRDNNSLAA